MNIAAIASAAFLVATLISPSFAQPQPPPQAALVTALSLNDITNAVATAPNGRIFVGFPHLDGSPGLKAAEVKNGALHPFPDAAWNEWAPGKDASKAFVRVNALRIGPNGKLWIVDVGAPTFNATVVPGGVKIVQVDLETNKVSRIYSLASVTEPKSYIDDIRFHGHIGYITDAGVPGLIVLNLDSGEARRVLDHDRSTTDERPMRAEGHVMVGPDGKEVRIQADQLEVSPDGQYLYYQPCSGPLYRIETRWLDDPTVSKEELSRHVKLWVDTPTTGGTAIDAAGNIYLSDTDKDQILTIAPDGQMKVLVQDPRLIWPDAMWIDDTGFLWIPAAQIDRIAPFNNGTSKVQLPIHVYKLEIGQTPPPTDHP